ncbi:MAG: hypothetical protein K6T83_08980 [Alicyclobacillus sp.]|nr:hypothetical protein [Alicyclobacillus sp.]
MWLLGRLISVTCLMPLPGHTDYVDDPAVAIVQLLNENSIFWETGDVPLTSYKRELDARWNAWLLREYGGRDGLSAAWTKADGSQALQPDEDPEQGTVRPPMAGRWGERTVDYRMDYTNVAGPARFADHVRFLTEIELNYIREMKAYLPCNILISATADYRCRRKRQLGDGLGWSAPD